MPIFSVKESQCENKKRKISQSSHTEKLKGAITGTYALYDPKI